MFKFNFGDKSENSNEEGPKSTLDWYESRRMKIPLDMDERLKKIEDKHIVKLHYEGNLTLTSLSPQKVIEGLKKEGTQSEELLDVLEADKNHSDLVPGKYEGGLKIWDCTRDLVNYLANNVYDSFKGKNVLDLGCGAGILGIVALLRGASVVFQDYNAEVLDLITIPNVYLNKDNIENDNNVEFYSGDWASFSDVISQKEDLSHNQEEPLPKYKKSEAKFRKFDYILTSETIYNPDNYGKIYKVMKELLCNNGTCYLAAKTCYFGVGGNVQGFTDYIKKENVFDVDSCWQSKEGVTREILKITFSKEHT